MFHFVPIAEDSKYCAKDGTCQCQEHIVDDLTRLGPRLGEFNLEIIWRALPASGAFGNGFGVLMFPVFTTQTWWSRMGIWGLGHSHFSCPHPVLLGWTWLDAAAIRPCERPVQWTTPRKFEKALSGMGWVLVGWAVGTLITL